MADACVAAASSRRSPSRRREGDRVGEERRGARGVADRLLEHRVLVEGRGGRVLVAQLAVVGDRRCGAPQVRASASPLRSESPAPASSASTRSGGALGRGDQRRVEPAVALGEVAAVQPEAPQRRGQAQGRLRIAAQREGQRRAQVVVLGLQRAQRAARAGGERVVLLGQGQAPVEVAHGRPLVLARRVEALGGVLADGVEQAEAPARSTTTSDLSTSRASRSTISPPGDGAAGAHLLGGLQREAAGEDGQAAEEHALLAGEQVVAPLDRGAQRLLARARRAAAAGEDVEAVVQARRDLVERQRRRRAPRPARWPAACRPGAGRSPRSSPRPARSGEAGVAPAARSTNRRLGLGQRRHAPGDLALAVQRLAARGQDAHAGPGAQQVLGQARAGVDDVLAVVEHDDRLAARQVRGERLLRRALGRDRDADGQRPWPAPRARRRSGRRARRTRCRRGPARSAPASRWPGASCRSRPGRSA